MPRPYAVAFEAVAITATQDLFEITPADDKPIAIMGYTLDNVGGAADAGDAQEEILRVSVVRGHTTSGSGGSTPTPVPLSGIDTAAGFTVEANNTTIASAGTTTVVPFGWNVRTAGRELWPQEMWIWASQANTTICLRLGTAPADSLTTSGVLYVMEYP